MRLEEKQKELSDYEAETINVIRGKSRLNVDLLNSLVAKCKEEIAELSQEVEMQKAEMEHQLESAAQEQAEFEKLESWADLYDNCTFEAKKMIVMVDSRLGWEPSMEYMTDRAHLEWKLEQLRRVVEEELPELIEKLRETTDM